MVEMRRYVDTDGEIRGGKWAGVEGQLASLLSCTTSPTPHESFSSEGSYRPMGAGNCEAVTVSYCAPDGVCRVRLRACCWWAPPLRIRLGRDDGRRLARVEMRANERSMWLLFRQRHEPLRNGRPAARSRRAGLPARTRIRRERPAATRHRCAKSYRPRKIFP